MLECVERSALCSCWSVWEDLLCVHVEVCGKICSGFSGVCGKICFVFWCVLDIGITECVCRFRVCTGELGEDVVPSSNPASPRFVESQEALRLLKGGDRAADQDEWTESFSEVDLHSVYFSEQDLFLPEEVFFSDNQLKSFLPSLTTMLKRLKPYPVSHLLDHHQTESLLYEHLMIREFSLYSDVPYKGPVSSSSPQYDVEEFGKEMILGAEDLMLPDFIETDVPQNQELITCSIIKHREALNLTPEPVEEHGSVLEALLKVPFRSYVELEMDLILSPPPPPPPPSPDWKLFVSPSQLSAETLSPVDRVCLLSDRECEVLENEVWVAEKHTQEVVRLLLAVSPAAENRDTENAVPARICKSKTVIFVLQEHDSPKRETEEKVCVSSKTSSDAVCSSARNTPTDPADVSDNKAKHKSLLKSGPKPVPYSHSQENPQNTGALSHPVRGTDTSTSLLRSTPHTVTHTPLRKENRNTFSESVTHQTGNFRLHSTHSAHKPSAETTAVDRRLSVCYTPRKRSASAQRDLPLENRHVTDHHNDPATHRKAPSPNLEHAYSNKDTATDLLQMSPTHQLSQDMTEQEHVRVQQEKKTSTTSTSHTQSFPSNHTNHLSDLLPENPSKNSAVLEPLSTPHTYEEIVSHTRNAASHTPKHQNSGQTLTPTRSPHRAEEQTPDSGPRSSTGMKRARLCVQRPQEFLDPVSSFMMLRGVLRFQLEQRAEETPQCTTDKQTVAESSQESTLKPTDGLDKTVVEQATEKKKNPESSCPVPERSTCETVHVPPTDTEKRAYWELHALVSPVLYRALSSGAAISEQEVGGALAQSAAPAGAHQHLAAEHI
ncbi:hypothetical protein C0J45_8924 [Silurus meridionalis]|nr:hypothetical protein C0J45_8924 [Silurus meridionalis]